MPDAPDQVLLVLDGSTGQNAYEQAKQFAQATEISALAITKLDGTAKRRCGDWDFTPNENPRKIHRSRRKDDRFATFQRNGICRFSLFRQLTRRALRNTSLHSRKFSPREAHPSPRRHRRT